MAGIVDWLFCLPLISVFYWMSAGVMSAINWPCLLEMKLLGSDIIPHILEREKRQPTNTQNYALTTTHMEDPLTSYFLSDSKEVYTFFPPGVTKSVWMESYHCPHFKGN